MLPSSALYTSLKWMIALLALTLTTTCYAQIDSIAQDTFPNATAEPYADPILIYEQRATKRALRQKNRRTAYQNRLPKNHNPKTAALLALIPGGGQIYNRRYWKLPIVWGGVGTLGYFMITTKIEFECYKKAYIHLTDDDAGTNYICPQAPDGIEASDLFIARNNARSTSEIMIIGFTVFYGLTIIDAFVDAHLAHFDIDDDLSMRLQPSLQYEPFQQQVMPSLGICVFPRVATAPRYTVSFE